MRRDFFRLRGKIRRAKRRYKGVFRAGGFRFFGYAVLLIERKLAPEVVFYGNAKLCKAKQEHRAGKIGHTPRVKQNFAAALELFRVNLRFAAKFAFIKLPQCAKPGVFRCALDGFGKKLLPRRFWMELYARIPYGAEFFKGAAAFVLKAFRQAKIFAVLFPQIHLIGGVIKQCEVGRKAPLA